MVCVRRIVSFCRGRRSYRVGRASPDAREECWQIGPLSLYRHMRVGVECGVSFIRKADGDLGARVKCSSSNHVLGCHLRRNHDGEVPRVPGRPAACVRSYPRVGEHACTRQGPGIGRQLRLAARGVDGHHVDRQGSHRSHDKQHDDRNQHDHNPVLMVG